jgi:hypothetical protein
MESAWSMTWLAQQQGDCHAAWSRFAVSLEIWQHLGGKRGIAVCLEGFTGRVEH